MPAGRRPALEARARCAPWSMKRVPWAARPCRSQKERSRMGNGSGRKRVWSGGSGRASTWREEIELDSGVFSAGVTEFEGVAE